MLQQIQDQSLRPLTTAHLAQTMTLLALPNLELRDRILNELATNPALELVDERVCPTCRRHLASRGHCPTCTAPSDNESPIVFLSSRDAPRQPRPNEYGDAPLDMEPAAPENLAENTLAQLAAELETGQRYLAAYILASLDEDGFLQDQPAFIARATRSTLTDVMRVISLISRADPPGLATAGPREALLAQLDLLGEPSAEIELAKRMLTETFTALGRRDYDGIARVLGVRLDSVRTAAEFIRRNLNPYPARAFWGSGRQAQPGDPTVYHNPDIQISSNPNGAETGLVVEVFAPLAGWLRVNPLFRQAMSQAAETPSDEWTQDLERASLLVKCLQQRNNTMRRLMEILATDQREFIVRGDRFLHPMTRARIAAELGVHESTISRAVAHKSVALPDGRIVPLARFFDRSLSVRDRIKEIVDTETRPLTDDEISAILEHEGVQVARRTVAKYRAMEGILPARLRNRKQGNEAVRSYLCQAA